MRCPVKKYFFGLNLKYISYEINHAWSCEFFRDFVKIAFRGMLRVIL